MNFVIIIINYHYHYHYYQLHTASIINITPKVPDLNHAQPLIVLDLPNSVFNALNKLPRYVVLGAA